MVDPATARVIAEVPQASADDVDEAVRAAREAFPAWSRLSPGKRKRAIEKLAQLTEEHRDELAELESLESGFPVQLTRTITSKAVARNLEYYASWIDKLYGEVVPLPGGDALDYTVRVPLGVVAAITPWNGPLLFVGSKVAPALAAGNTVVLKPSEHAPLAVLRWAELVEQAGIPAGVVNVVTGDGRVGAALAEHPVPAKLSFTGGAATGKKVMEKAGRTLKRLTLELGGKSPQIVCADANLQKAAMMCAFGVFACAGQLCAAGSRVLVEAAAYDRFLEMLTELAKGLPLGDPLDEATIVGPLISQAQLERVLGFVQSGRAEGARLALGGERVAGDGYFVRPTIFTDVRPQMRIAREEIFGPVLAVFRFDDLDEAIRLANDTPYGLAAGVWTADLRKAHAIARQLEVGTAWINTYGQLPYTTPFGGMKESGFGREGGRNGIEEFTQVRNVYVDLS